MSLCCFLPIIPTTFKISYICRGAFSILLDISFLIICNFSLKKSLERLGLLKLSLSLFKFYITLLSEFYNLGQEALHLHIAITYFWVNWAKQHMTVSLKLLEELPLGYTSNKVFGTRVLGFSVSAQPHNSNTDLSNLGFITSCPWGIVPSSPTAGHLHPYQGSHRK